MIPKWFIWFCIIIGSTIGGSLPMLFGAGAFSFWAIIGSGIGGIAGIFVAVKVGNSF